MALRSGTHLGPYEILEPLGAGGMGEVYRARDTRLGREVAVKVLSPELSGSPMLRERLEREAKAVASLNHSHICTLHDVGREGEVDFLVMEHLEGETLADRLRRGRLPLEQALRYASEVAEALEAAHRHGIVHRDLKPGNVMLTKSGTKLLDFGLARLRSTAPREDRDGLSQESTLASPFTEEGTIMGTYPYMAPEQLEGRPADARSDVFAFGAVLQEMLTGERAFAGESRASVIAAILEHEPPPVSALQRAASPMLDRVVARCLAKDPDQRWQSAGDLAAELRWIAEGGVETGRGPDSIGRLRRERVAWGLGLMVTALTGALLGMLWIGRRGPDVAHDTPGTPVRFTLSLPPSQQIDVRVDGRQLSVSPDGQYMAWVGGPPDARRVFLRSFERLEVEPLVGTEGAFFSPPQFSPDGERVLFVRDGALWTIRRDGGLPTRVLETKTAWGVWGADWIDEENIAVSLAQSGLCRMAARGGSLEPITRLDGAAGEVAHEHPHVLPGGRAILFCVVVGNFQDQHLEVVDLETGDRRRIADDAAIAQYGPTGHVVFGRDDMLVAVPFDLERLEVTGPESALLAPVQMDAFGRSAHFALSRSGRLIYVPGDQGFNERRLEWRHRDGRVEPLPLEPRNVVETELSPGGRRLALSIQEGRRVLLQSYDLDRHVLAPLETAGSWNSSPVWSPDGSRLAFMSNRSGQMNLFTVSTLGAGEAVRLQESREIQLPGSWSPDGSLLAYIRRASDDQVDIWLLPIREAGSRPIPFLTSSAMELHPAFSPKGRWLAYASDETGQLEVYVRAVLPDLAAGRPQKVSRAGGWHPVWSSDGKELFFLGLDGKRILSASVASGAELVLGGEREVMDGLDLGGPMGRRFDVAPDEESLLIASPIRDPEAPMRLVIALNWDRELERLTPRDGGQ